MTFGEILRELLDENDLTQKDLAADLNMGATTIGNYVRGVREPDFETLKAFAAYFHVSTDYLLDFHGSPERTHCEDELLRVYRALPSSQKALLLEQGKLLLRMNKSREKP
ncbi:MAG: helix-turn-helix transcriptional regulator [Oscillospiraceae bacterium]|nr:helix-turn-helix transcriptional regulator [Oscillospiraceae bacterium]